MVFSRNRPSTYHMFEQHDPLSELFLRTASDILSAVQTTQKTHGTNSVTIVGHSLGSALSLIDAVFLPLHLQSSTFKFVGYSMPRVGNPKFADFLDGRIPHL